MFHVIFFEEWPPGFVLVWFDGFSGLKCYKGSGVRVSEELRVALPYRHVSIQGSSHKDILQLY